MKTVNQDILIPNKLSRGITFLHCQNDNCTYHNFIFHNGSVLLLWVILLTE